MCPTRQSVLAKSEWVICAREQILMIEIRASGPISCIFPFFPLWRADTELSESLVCDQCIRLDFTFLVLRTRESSVTTL